MTTRTRRTAAQKAEQEKDAAAQAAAKEQHPALDGRPADEVDQRTADGEATGMRFRKEFVVLGTFGDAHPIHEQNRQAVHNEAIQRGLHPKAVAVYVGTEESVPDRRGNVTSTMTYEVECVPAVVDPDTEATVAPSDVIDEKPDQVED